MYEKKQQFYEQKIQNVTRQLESLLPSVDNAVYDGVPRMRLLITIGDPSGLNENAIRLEELDLIEPKFMDFLVLRPPRFLRTRSRSATLAQCRTEGVTQPGQLIAREYLYEPDSLEVNGLFLRGSVLSYEVHYILPKRSGDSEYAGFVFDIVRTPLMLEDERMDESWHMDVSYLEQNSSGCDLARSFLAEHGFADLDSTATRAPEFLEFCINHSLAQGWAASHGERWPEMLS